MTWRDLTLLGAAVGLSAFTGAAVLFAILTLLETM